MNGSKARQELGESSSSTGIHDNKRAKKTTNYYHSSTSKEIREGIEHAVVEAFEEATWVDDEVKRVEFVPWVEDPRNTRPHMAQLNRTLNLLWTLKVMLGKAMGNKVKDLQLIVDKLDKIDKDLEALHLVPRQLKILDAKMGLLEKYVGAKFIATTTPLNTDPPKQSGQPQFINLADSNGEA